MNVVTYEAHGHTFVVAWDDGSTASACRQIALWATNRAIPFGWRDAAVLAQKIYQQRHEFSRAPQQNHLPMR